MRVGTAVRKLRVAMIVAIGAVAVSSPASTVAFGTIVGMGQNAEHSRITRRALGCDATFRADACFEARTLDNLAGEIGGFGAVGAPDRGRSILDFAAHCDSGDHLDIPGYPQSAAQAQVTLEQCRARMVDNLAHAVADAAGLLDADGRIKSREVSLAIDCVYAGNAHGRAKCDVLGHLGQILHASQDFYSHSNWTDQPDSGRPIGPDNPPGLGNRGRAPWLDLRVASPVFPAGLISGCASVSSLRDDNRGCPDGEGGVRRVRHANLNKDQGTMDPEIGQGATDRGAINDNFRNAVEAAIDDSADKFATFREQVLATYGEERGRRMICAIVSDDPARNCP